MATTATATRIAGPGAVGNEMYCGLFTLLLDTTTADGLLTIDLTTWFDYVYAIEVAGELVATKTGYMVKAYNPGAAVAVTATNSYVGIYESAGDGDELDPLASTDVSGVITGLTIVVWGKQAA